MDSSLFKIRRETFTSAMRENSIAVFFSGKAPRKSADSFYPFQVDRNFYYLTGIRRDDMVLVLSKMTGKVEEFLYIPPVKELYEKWVGILMREGEAVEVSGVKVIRDRRDCETELFDRLSNGKPDAVYLFFTNTRLDEPLNLEQKLAERIRTQFPQIQILNACDVLAEMRIIKSPEEIEQIRKAIALTGQALTKVLENLQPGQYEYEAKAFFESVLLHQGAGEAFDVIAASGSNATIMHYVDVNRQMQAGELLLMDCGAAVGLYCADITRTFPVDGHFSSRQRDIYNIVLAAQQAAFELIKPGEIMSEINKKIIALYAKELKTIKLIEQDAEVSNYYYHGLGHPLGLDVHDLRLREDVLKEGMVYTVEPGLYLAKEQFGVRIEDNVLLTRDGNENLSQEIIKDRNEIELRMTS